MTKPQVLAGCRRGRGDYEHSQAGKMTMAAVTSEHSSGRHHRRWGRAMARWPTGTMVRLASWECSRSMVRSAAGMVPSCSKRQAISTDRWPAGRQPVIPGSGTEELTGLQGIGRLRRRAWSGSDLRDRVPASVRRPLE